MCDAPRSGNTLRGCPCFLSIGRSNYWTMAAPVSGAPIALLSVVMGAKTLPRRRCIIPRADGAPVAPYPCTHVAAPGTPRAPANLRLRAINTPHSYDSARAPVRQARGPTVPVASNHA